MEEGWFARFTRRLRESRARAKDARRGYTPLQRRTEKQVSACAALALASSYIPAIFGQEIGKSTRWVERASVSLVCFFVLASIALIVRYLQREQDEYARAVVVRMLLRSTAVTFIFNLCWTLGDVWSGSDLRSDYLLFINFSIFYISCVFQQLSMLRRNQ